MRHTDWLRLKTQGENICAVLRQQGYQCRKQTRHLAWKVSKEGISYVLTWLSVPIGEWSLIPNNDEPERSKLMSIVHSALNPDKGSESQSKQLISKPDDRKEDGEVESWGNGENFEPPSVHPPLGEVETFREEVPVRAASCSQGGFSTQRHQVSPPLHLGNDPARPWAIVRLLPGNRRYPVARFFNRQDAQDHKRTLNRFIPAAEFEIVFDAIESEDRR